MIRITICCALAPREVFEQTVELEEGALLREAVAASALAAQHPALDWEAMAPGIWGRAASWSQALAQGDRVELCRPLVVDPKVARRERFQQQGSRRAGLFARRRPGGKAGY